ncbi:hypothetical protein G7Y89_g5198 [Cudoniella acicularis]|uniref:Uncharacterized protein n=1 Tax=Cudoniella acicularis TaxID=354080 RepID=A0A8H4RPG7_9HELO|nr:hypothetical protein G7Y89_g5198 [Cudoniella acicularis]
MIGTTSSYLYSIYDTIFGNDLRSLLLVRQAIRSLVTTNIITPRILREDSAISDDGEDHKYDKGEKTHACFEGGVVTGKLEEDRDHIDRDKDYGSAYSGYSEEDKHSPRLEKLYREDTSASGGENGVNLLKS